MIKVVSSAVLLTLAAIITGCVSNPSQNIRQVTEQQAFVALAKQDELAKQSKESFLKLLKTKELGIKDTLAWKQPQNKSEECRLWFAGNWPENLEIFWDGGCKDGYAYGLGREFVKGTRADEIIDKEDVAYYQGGKKKPIYLTSYDRVKKSYSLNAYGSDVGGILNTLVQSPKGTEVITFVVNNKFLPETGYRYVLKTSSATNDLEYFKDAGNNVKTIIVDVDNAAMKKIFFDGVYEIEVLTDGRVLNIDKRSNSLIQLPKSYRENAVRIDQETKDAAQEIFSMTRKSQEMVDYYKNNVCKDSVKVSFISNEQYKEICGKDGYLTSFMPEVEKTREENLASRKADYERWIAQQEQAKQDRYRQQMVTAAQRQAKAAEDANFQSSLQALNNQISNMNNNMMNTINSFQSPYSGYSAPKPRTPTFYNRIGNSIVGSDGTTCTSVGNSVICN